MEEEFDHQILRRHKFGLVDAARLVDLPGGLCVEAVVPEALTGSAHLMPGLIDFRKTSASGLTELLEMLYQSHLAGSQPPVTLLACTDVTSAEFIRHWNSLQYPALPSGQKAWLRLHDPRVVHQLLRIFTSSQRRYLFGKAELLTYWLNNKWLAASKFEGIMPEYADPEPRAARYAGTSTWDWPRIEKIGTLNRIFLRARIQEPAEVKEKSGTAEGLIERAAVRHGLVDQDDLVEFAARALLTRDDFDEHPVIAKAIKPAVEADEDSSLADRFALIDKHIWQEIGLPVEK